MTINTPFDPNEDLNHTHGSNTFINYLNANLTAASVRLTTRVSIDLQDILLSTSAIGYLSYRYVARNKARWMAAFWCLLTRHVLFMAGVKWLAAWILFVRAKEHLTALMVIQRFVLSALPKQASRNRQIMDPFNGDWCWIQQSEFKDLLLGSVQWIALTD